MPLAVRMALGHPGPQGTRENGESESKLRAQWLPVVNGVASSGGSTARGQHGHQHPHPGLRGCLSLWWPRRGAAQCQAGLGRRAPSGLGAVTSIEQGWGWRSLPARGPRGHVSGLVATLFPRLLLSSVATARKPRYVRNACLCPVRLYLRTLKSEFHVIFMCHGLLLF